MVIISLCDQTHQHMVKNTDYQMLMPHYSHILSSKYNVYTDKIFCV